MGEPLGEEGKTVKSIMILMTALVTLLSAYGGYAIGEYYPETKMPPAIGAILFGLLGLVGTVATINCFFGNGPAHDEQIKFTPRKRKNP